MKNLKHFLIELIIFALVAIIYTIGHMCIILHFATFSHWIHWIFLLIAFPIIIYPVCSFWESTLKKLFKQED